VSKRRRKKREAKLELPPRLIKRLEKFLDTVEEEEEMEKTEKMWLSSAAWLNLREHQMVEAALELDVKRLNRKLKYIL